MVDGFCQGTIGINGFSMVFQIQITGFSIGFLTIEWMVLRLTIGINGFSMVHKKRESQQKNMICDKNRGK